ncbi:hypothetical protein [Bacillus sp. FJAT-50079]|uniref:hypothetical protein n=1 Tax=Bacillus sp. FJAT-50079 TaxID=2833577 RepID=UPI001BC8D055|nr:hypothetical protein [Bacillus sp. FJAT-50079]MBS4207450.1 hypothetical protein [Bacillus sp. FJAT-50079]
MKSKTIKVLNNANEIIKVTQKAWEILYKDRDGFSLYIEEAEEKPKEEKPKTKPKTATKKKPSSDKRVKKDD